jgi:hypothetical protein
MFIKKEDKMHLLLFLDNNMEEIDQFEPLSNKHIRGSFSRGLGLNEEIREAKKTPIYWWFLTLQASDEYLLCCRNQGKGKLANLYKDFGDIDKKSFAQWWANQGRKIFAERKKFKKVEVVEDRRQLERLSIHKDRLIIEVPLSLRRQTAIRQIGRELKKVYESRDFVDIWKQSSAKRQVIKSKVRMSTVELLLNIWQIRNEHPTLSNYEIGQKAKIDLDIFARTTDGDQIDEALERRRMQIAVSRYLSQAKNLIANAEKGIFPSLQDPAKT